MKTCFSFFGCAPNQDNLKRELAVMRASIKTGITQPTFTERFVQLRAARSLCKLNEDQEFQFQKIEKLSEICLYFWQEQIERTDKYGFAYSWGKPTQEAKRGGITLRISGESPSEKYQPETAISDLFDKLAESIEALQNEL